VLTASHAYSRAAALVAFAIVATACNSGSKHASTSTSASVPSSAVASTPASTAEAGTSRSAVSASTAAASAVVSPRVVVELARSHRVVAKLGTVDVVEPSVVGLPDDAAISAALQVPATTALAGYAKFIASVPPCTGPACGSGAFHANFTTSRADSVVVSGTWTISTFFPGGAHPTTQLTALIIDATTGASISPSQLFVGSSLKALATATRTAATAKLDAIGCNVDEGEAEFAEGTAATADNYAGTAIDRTGLLVSLSQGQVAAEACGPLDVAIAWSTLQPHLSSLGADLAVLHAG
jgi:hypothetical protein